MKSITLKTINELTTGKTIRCGKNPGLSARRSKNGTVSFYYRYIVNGMERRPKIGVYPTMTLDDVKSIMGRMKTEVFNGKDPLAERHRAKGTPTLAEFKDTFLADECPAKSYVGYESMLRLHLVPELGKRRLSDITAADAIALHKRLSKDRPFLANRVAQLLRRIINVAMDDPYNYFSEGNPCRKIKWNKESPRERYLDEDEAEAFFAAVDQTATEYDDAALRVYFRVLLETGSRRDEILKAEWTWFNKDMTKLHLPDSKGGRRTIEVPDEITEMLKVIPRISERVFWRKKFPDRPWNRIKELSGIQWMRPHDLRHTYASWAIAEGQTLHEIGGQLGHTNPKTTMRYAHLMDKVARENVNNVSARFAKFDKGRETLKG